MKFDLTDYWEEQSPGKEIRTTLTATFRLDRQTILDVLSVELIKVDGHYYEVPESHLLHLLLNKKYGDTELTLIRIEK